MNENPMEVQNKALNSLVAAVRLAQSRGAFTLEEAAQILEFIKVFAPPAEAAQAAAPAPAAAVEEPVVQN
jgi:hypothetical protein